MPQSEVVNTNTSLTQVKAVDQAVTLAKMVQEHYFLLLGSVGCLLWPCQHLHGVEGQL